MKYQLPFILMVMLIAFSSCGGSVAQTENNSEFKTATDDISGNVRNGLRIINIAQGPSLDIRVYRGDYIVPVLKGKETFTVEVPRLKIRKSYPASAGEKNYIKMKKPGTYKIIIGDLKGTIEVKEYTEPHYKPVTSREAEQIIKNIDPLVLDVRTTMEYSRGHLKGSILIPVQELQYRLKEMESYKDKDILIYCATGNRSTVAAKILIDNGFKKIYNLNGGIADWRRSGFPIN